MISHLLVCCLVQTLLTPLTPVFCSFETVRRRLRDKQTTPERLEAIFDRFDAWEDPEPQIEAAGESRLEIVVRNVKQQISNVLADQRRVESKVDLLLTHFGK